MIWVGPRLHPSTHRTSVSKSTAQMRPVNLSGPTPRATTRNGTSSDFSRSKTRLPFTQHPRQPCTDNRSSKLSRVASLLTFTIPTHPEASLPPMSTRKSSKLIPGFGSWSKVRKSCAVCARQSQKPHTTISSATLAGPTLTATRNNGIRDV
jgi:hypothetical protein